MAYLPITFFFFFVLLLLFFFFLITPKHTTTRQLQHYWQQLESRSCMGWVSFIYSQMDTSLHTCCYTIHLITYLQFYLLKYNTLLHIFNYIYLNALVKTNCFLHSSANKKKKSFFFPTFKEFLVHLITYLQFYLLKYNTLLHIFNMAELYSKQLLSW